MDNAPVGLYIHIPFCVRKCRYCDFFSSSDLSLIDGYASAVLREIASADSLPASVDTVYFGGGTPSVLGANRIGTLLGAVSERFFFAEKPEITLEVNPGTIGTNDLAEYAAAGVNRLNIGVQSFNNDNLAFLGRVHDVDEATSAITEAQEAGFANIGLDLIYGLPDQRMDAWIADLDAALAYAPAHLSCYMLTYEKGTPLEKARQQGEFTPLDDAATAELFLHTRQYLQEHGYSHYEISNFARGAQHTSRHNSKYWNFTPYLGFGPSAHSFSWPERWWNVADLHRYIDSMTSGTGAVEGRERLTRDQLMTEAVMLGLRKTEGISLARFEELFGEAFTDRFEEVLVQIKMQDLLELTDTSCRLTERGLLLINEVVRRLSEAV
jgi:oxygen-independent coproporphyrinogen-3 oxidase